jgi:hypothetical protein
MTANGGARVIGPYAMLSPEEVRAVLKALGRQEQPPEPLIHAIKKMRKALLYEDVPEYHKAFKEPCI